MAVINGFKNYDIDKDGSIVSLRSGERLNPYKVGKSKKHHGYLKIKLFNDQGNRKAWHISRLVYTAYIGEIPKGYEIDHIDGNRSNNHLDNLRMVTHTQNLKLKTIRLAN